MSAWSLDIPEVPPSGNVIKRMAWPVYKRLLERWFLLVRSAHGFLDIPQATGKRKLVLCRHATRTLDRDNLYAAMKPVIDVLRPMRHEEGYYKAGKRKGEYWSRRRIGHGLIQEDDAEHLDLVVLQARTSKGEAPHLTLLLEDLEEAPIGTL